MRLTWGICVVLPLPVSPITMAVCKPCICRKNLFRARKIGNFFRSTSKFFGSTLPVFGDLEGIAWPDDGESC